MSVSVHRSRQRTHQFNADLGKTSRHELNNLLPFSFDNGLRSFLKHTNLKQGEFLRGKQMANGRLNLLKIGRKLTYLKIKKFRLILILSEVVCYSTLG